MKVRVDRRQINCSKYGIAYFYHKLPNGKFEMVRDSSLATDMPREECIDVIESTEFFPFNENEYRHCGPFEITQILLHMEPWEAEGKRYEIVFEAPTNEPGKVSNTFHDILTASGLTMRQISERYQIPYRTLQNWKSGIRKPPEYVLLLLKDALNLPSE